MRILLAQINPTIGDLKGNSRLIADACTEGRAQKADIVLFPELALTGYPPEDFLLLPHFIEDTAAALEDLLPATMGIIAIIGLPRHNPHGGEKHLLNSAAIVENGKIIGYQDKTLLPTYDVFDERRYFEPNKQPPKVWELAGKRVAITICEDLWNHSKLLKSVDYQRDPVEELMALQPDILLNLSASPFHSDKFSRRCETVTLAARTLKCPALLCNQVGGNDSLIFDGASLCVNAEGVMTQCAASFAEDLLLIDTTQQAVHTTKAPSIEADLYAAIVLGLRDYFKKSGFSKACLGLSGGIDSAVTACLAVEALGKENVLGVLMPSRYSSQGSIDDSVKLAQALQIETTQISIEEPFEAYLKVLAPNFSERMPDVTEENMQARIRGMLLMALSNKFGYIVLSTGNKSELALGYSTLYGDLCGGLAILSDLTKQQVYALAHYINREREIIPQNSILKPPSAELRPNQKDTDSLPDYTIVDNVLQDYIEDHLSASEIAVRHGYPLQVVEDLIFRIHQNEYKRRQAPPGLRVSEKAFSVGRRFPIVQKYVRRTSNLPKV